MRSKNTLIALSNWLLHQIYGQELYNEIEGDLQELYSERLIRSGKTKASLMYLWDTILSLRNIRLRKKKLRNNGSFMMLPGYFKIAGRHLMKSKSFSLINVLGLAVGIASFFLITQYISFELSYDQFHSNSDQIYRVALERNINGEVVGSTRTFTGLKRLLKENFPEIEHVTSFYRTPANTGFLFRHNGKIYNEPGGIINPDSSFFRVFPSLMIQGDVSSAVDRTGNIVLSEAMATKIFGNVNPIGKTLERLDGDGNDWLVTGVLKDIPRNSHFHANFIPADVNYRPNGGEWDESFVFTYLTLLSGSQPDNIIHRINMLLRQVGEKERYVKGVTVVLQPINDIHLSSQYKDEFEINGNKTLLYSLGAIAIIILLMAWINYINLESARFISRLKEVGVRRVIGSGKSDLIMQFMVEYLCLTAVALIVAVMLIGFTLPWFSALSEIPVRDIHWMSPIQWTVALSIFVIGSLVAGTYPALFLARLNPLLSLKGKSGQAKKGLLRKSLLTIQFVSSLILIAFVLVITEQLDLMRSSNKKLETEQVIALRNPTAYGGDEAKDMNTSFRAFENKLLQSASIRTVTGSSAIPGTEIGFNFINLLKRNTNDPYDPTIHKTLFVGSNFIPAYGIRLLAGRNFSQPTLNTGWTPPWEDPGRFSIILNESAMKHLGFNSPSEAIGNEVFYQNLFDDGLQKHTIIGITEDYHHEAIKKQVHPIIFQNNYDTFQQVYYSIRLNTGIDTHDALNYIKLSWASIFPDKPFEYFFIDDYYDQQFKSELQFESLFTLFASIAIFIACLGILGITLFESTVRLKEISIRKVLGATPASLVTLLSRDHVRIVFLSFLIAGPFIYYFTEQWLTTYPVRIDVSPAYFLIPFGVILVMVIITSSFQTVRAANANPIEHLKQD